MQTPMSHHDQERPHAYPSRRHAAGATATALGILAATGVVASAYSMGARWLGEPIAGLPAGVWAIPVVFGLIHWSTFRPRWLASQTADTLNRALFGATRLPALNSRASDTSRGGDLMLGIAGSLTSLTARLTTRPVQWLHAQTRGRSSNTDSFARAFCQWHDRLAWPTRPAHVALVGLSDRVRRSLIDTPDAAGIRWFQGDARLDDSVLCERHTLDAVVNADADSRVQIATSEHAGQDAAWYDWGTRCPISYASVFPGRLDPSLATLGPVDTSDTHVVASLTTAACVLSRHPARLSALDRARGRRPIDLPVSGPIDNHGHPVVSAMHDLIDHVESWPVGKPASGAIRVAARVTSAWLAGTACGLEPADRLPGLEAAARILTDEPEAMLRLAAVRIAAGKDDLGLSALVEADALLRESDEAAQVDPFAFLQAELEAGESSPMTVGRVAAGICMVCTRTPAERLPYLRDDIMDDMRYAEWLIGSDPDRMLLYRVFDEIAACRRPTEPLLQAA